MGILSIARVQIGQVSIIPGTVKVQTTDNLATITAAGYLKPNMIDGGIVSTDVFQIEYSYSKITNTGTFDIFVPTITNGVTTLVKEFVTTSSTGGQTVSTTVTSATPGTVRALVASITQTATTMTSGNIVGVRGVVTAVGASGGFLYGVQGKVILTGTISGSEWTAGLFGQVDISAATINAGQIAPIWGDYGTSSHTLTDRTGMYGIAMTNTTAAVLEANVYLYGGATNLFLLSDNNGGVGASYFVAAGTSAGSAGDTSKCNATKVLTISVNGTSYYIPLFAQNS